MAADSDLRVSARKKMSRGKGRKRKMKNEMALMTKGNTEKKIGKPVIEIIQITTQTNTDALMLRLQWYQSGQTMIKYL